MLVMGNIDAPDGELGGVRMIHPPPPATEPKTEDERAGGDGEPCEEELSHANTGGFVDRTMGITGGSAVARITEWRLAPTLLDLHRSRC